MILKLYRRYIANQVEEKMAYMGSCPNERDIILRVIDPVWHKDKAVPHCKTNCWSTSCRLSKNFKEE